MRTISNNTTCDHLHHLAFTKSLLANIIHVVDNGNIIGVNMAACKLLGYTKKLLLTKNVSDLFICTEKIYKQMLGHRTKAGHATGDLTAIKNGGKWLPCQVTSVEFIGEHNIKKVITTLVSRSDTIRKQKNIDSEKEKLAAANVIVTSQKYALLEDKLNDEISENEQLHSLSILQRIDFEKQWESEIKLKKIQIADAVSEAKELERSDLSKELHDNINQLLGASRLYMEMAKKSKPNRNIYLSKSSEYVLTAIEEIRKLTRGLICDALDKLGLCDAVGKIIRDLMDVYPIKISCEMDDKIQINLIRKANINIFRIVQEQLNNIIKHASASAVSIALSQSKTLVILTISDNGSGFDISVKSKGIGIDNIKSRAAFFNGHARFVSQPGKGCTLTVSFPKAIVTKVRQPELV